MRVTMRTQPLPQPGMVTQMPTADGVEYQQPAYADFPPQEHTARCARAREHMADQNLDALIISGRENVYYFAGIHAYASEIQDVYVFCVVPQDASLGVSVIASTIYSHFASMTWVPDLRLWDSNLFAGGSETHPAVRLLLDVLAEKKLRRGRLGFELGDDISMGAGRALTDELVEALPDAAIIDGGPAIWATRKIKSPAEHAYMRKATEITAHGMRASMDALKPGMSEREVAAVMMAEWFRLGATDRGLAMVYAGDRVMSYDTYPTDRRFQAGDIVQWDSGCQYHGYFSDFIRMAVIGPPTPRQRRNFDVAREAMDAGVQAVRPGATGADVVRAAHDVFDRSGYGEFTQKCRETGRDSAGHNLGLDVHEPPAVSLRSNEPLEPGQVICIEPFLIEDGVYPFDRARAFYVLEAVVLVTDTGHEVFSHEDLLPHELYVVE